MAEEFRELTERQHVIARPGVYVGSTTEEPVEGIIDFKYQRQQVVPALIKIIEEIFQNSIDEYIRTSGKHATNISLSIADTVDGTEIVIADDGRGIPIEKIGDSYRPVSAWTKLRAGSNFDDSKRIGAGTNGMGAALSNIFSTSFEGTTYDGKNKLTLTCSDNMEKVTFKVIKSVRSVTGTKVAFVPDLAKFGLKEFTADHTKVLRDRFTNLAIMYPGINFTFNGEKIRFKSIKEVAKQFHPYALSYESDGIRLVLAPAGSQEEFLCLSYVNGIYVSNGGSHVDYVLSKVIESLRATIKKKYKIDVLPNQIKQHLLFASWLSGFPALKFDSQSKQRITNSVANVSDFLSGVDFEKIAKQIASTPAIIDPIIAAILYRKERDEAKELDKKKKATSKLRIVKHIVATDPNPENRMLLVCEGDSAIGPLLAVRNPKTTGGYPLRGKPLNVRGMRPLEVLKNREMSELLSIIGLEFGKPATDLNYGKIVIFGDMDLDGQHIIALLLNLFSNWPELFDEQRIYRMISPLYYCTKGKQSKVFYTKEKFDAFDSRGWESTHIKGLGTMTEEMYDECVNNPVLELIQLDDPTKLEMCFGDDASLRKDWMMA